MKNEERKKKEREKKKDESGGSWGKWGCRWEAKVFIL